MQFCHSFGLVQTKGYKTPLSVVAMRAKVLYTDRLQKRVPIQEKVKTKKKQRFEEVAMARYMCLMRNFDGEYEMVTKTRQGNLGTDLPTLDTLFYSGQF